MIKYRLFSKKNIESIAAFNRELRKAYMHGKGKYKDLMLSDYHDIIHGLKLLEHVEIKNACKWIAELDTEVREKFPYCINELVENVYYGE